MSENGAGQGTLTGGSRGSRKPGNRREHGAWSADGLPAPSALLLLRSLCFLLFKSVSSVKSVVDFHWLPAEWGARHQMALPRRFPVEPVRANEPDFIFTRRANSKPLIANSLARALAASW